MICTKVQNIEKWVRNDIQIIIPMSGMGKRFVDVGYIDPKPLLIIDNKPIIEHVINLFPNENDISFICNDLHLSNTNMTQILKSTVPDCKIYEISSLFKKGPVYAVSTIFDKIDDQKEVIISYCDYGTFWSYINFLNDTRNRKADGAVVCYKGFHPHMLGKDNYAFLKEKEKNSRWMAEIKEKEPFTNNRMEEYASNGTYYFKNGKLLKYYFKKLIDSNITINNEFYVSMVFNLLVQDGLNVSIFEIENMLQWGTPYDLECYRYWSDYFNKISYKQKLLFQDNNQTTLILPLAGRGNRFQLKGYTKPKPLLDINGIPMIIQSVKNIPMCSKYIFVCLEEHIKNHQIDNKIKQYYPDSNVISINEVTNGQATTCRIAIENSKMDLEMPILISACDNGVYFDIKKYQKLVDDKSIDVIVWSFRNNPTSKNNPNMYAWVDVDNDNNIKYLSCKKFIGTNPLRSHAVVGTFYFRKAKYFLDGLHKNYSENINTNGEFYVDDVINQNIKDGLNVKVFEIEHYLCWGTPDDYETYIYWDNYFKKSITHKYPL